ncbi:rod shape-determining protein MreC [Parendozoicomonas haliclonae]|uniref:rod shape-determining protein MreC n=1 Tax=Parendozoicomonas haliclonae TaxID=1960125 RepID=UPI001A9A1B71|nr:rod shape-determining protein MreC [Parendozoicomonas haliclonae]
MFRKGQAIGARFTLLLALSLTLIFLDHRFDYLKEARRVLSVAVTPVLWLADLPARLTGTVQIMVSSRSELAEESARLKARNLILEQKLQKMASLNAQNVRLRELLNSSRLVDEKVVISELIGVDPDPRIKQVLINKGDLDGVHPGQPLLDANGVMGQVTQVGPLNSRVILLTDKTSRIPVQVNRNGFRAIASGTESGTELELLHIPGTADIKVGDLLVTSGMGGRFPVGYPVAEVTEVVQDPGHPFLSIRARPSAQLHYSRLVMLVFTSEREIYGHAQSLPDEPSSEGAATETKPEEKTP